MAKATDGPKVERVLIDSLEHYPGNARRGDIAMIVESLKAHGQFRTIVVQKSTRYVLAGNHTLLGAKELGWTHINVEWADVDDMQAKKIVLVDNRANDVAGYDIPSLAELLRSVDNLDGTGFNDEALAAVMASLEPIAILDEEKKDDAPDAPEEPTTRPGDIYLLGDHRLLCGDATDLTCYDKLLDGVLAHLLFADPPFNLNFDGFRVGKHRSDKSEKRTDAVMNDKQSDEDFLQFLRDFMVNAYANLEDGASVYVWMDWRKYAEIKTVFTEQFSHKNTIVWDKDQIGIGLYNYRTQYELMLFGTKGDRPKTWTAGRKERDVWRVQRERTKEYKHVNQKPVELAERAIRNSTLIGDVVLDPFCGSGTSLIACEALDRKCMAMELDPRYCDVIVRRWEDITGQKAELQES
jgi:DNA modification methylase